ncbi:MAG: hypothetical protein JW795_16610 [Chitinivibrionales bacterium]|nr:hypothetical protein [Chitinivibrionales bacterium]
MQIPFSKFQTLFLIVRHLGISGILAMIFSRIYSINHCYILGCNLKKLIVSKSIGRMLPIGVVRLLNDNDIASVTERIGGLTPHDRKELIFRIKFYSEGFKNCFVYLIEGKIAFMQWLIYPSENDLLRKHYGKKYKTLTPQQVLVENVFIFPEFRGQGLFPHLTIQLLKQAEQEGYTHALSYVKKNMIAPLNELIAAGFRIISLVEDVKLMGIEWRNL